MEKYSNASGVSRFLCHKVSPKYPKKVLICSLWCFKDIKTMILVKLNDNVK